MEARDRTPEQQFGHGAVGNNQRPDASSPAMSDGRPGCAPAMPRAARRGCRSDPFENGVVDRHQGRKVLVERRRLHAEAPGHLGQAEPVDSFFGHDLAGNVEDLLNRLLAPTRPTVGSRNVFHRPRGGPSGSRSLRSSIAKECLTAIAKTISLSITSRGGSDMQARVVDGG